MTSAAPRPAGMAGPCLIPPGETASPISLHWLSCRAEKVRFKYQSKDLGPMVQSHAPIAISHLSEAGKYLSHSANNDGIWNDSGVSLSRFTVLPRFWQTWWFTGAAGVAGFAPG